MFMHITVTEAIVLRHVDYGEADRIVTFLTAAGDVWKGFARHARSSRKRFGASLEPYSRVRVHWRPGRGDLASLQQVELLALRDGLRRELLSLTLAGYGCELAMEIVGEGGHQPGMFAWLDAFLDHLAAGGDPASARLLLELHFLQLAGYIPHLLHCSECFGRLGDPVAFSAARGGSLCDACASGRGEVTVGLATLGSLSRCLRGRPEQIGEIRLGATTLQETRPLLETALDSVLHRPLKSKKILEELLRNDRERT
ncbi:MAG: DNA repair protein RecO [Desulfuromonas sp.]|nr:MAG: DNA repair protein RecO [Desulfuromonas sp.]